MTTRTRPGRRPHDPHIGTAGAEERIVILDPPVRAREWNTRRSPASVATARIVRLHAPSPCMIYIAASVS